MNKMRVRYVKGYRLLYEPSHPSAMTSKNWIGYIYEHIMVAEDMVVGRKLKANEVVHHLDGNRLNNRHENLVVLSRGDHYKIHVWLDKGAPYVKAEGEQRMNSGESKALPVCSVCEKTLQDKQKDFCSEACYLSVKSAHLPSKEELIILLETKSSKGRRKKGKPMINKITKLLGSIRFWVITLGFASEYLSGVVANGFDWETLLIRIAAWLGAIGVIGTVDKAAAAIGFTGKK